MGALLRATWETIPVRGKEVFVTLRTICEFYNAPYYEFNFVEESVLEHFGDINLYNILKILKEGRGEWKHCPNTDIHTSFNQVIMFPYPKMWMNFLCTRIASALNVSNVNTFRVVLLYVVLQKKQVCIGTWIYNYMKIYITGQKVGVFFPHLVTALCKKARVPMTTTEQFMKPSKSLIGDTLYTEDEEVEKEEDEMEQDSQEEKNED
ncbi:hypothetical protein Gotri_026238 [Gossypium trilobum]|uniref:Putative plant transposon protein domain-containing protein n=1 Tax=Gossypium trilobum TaxID=34281 RepID=A0A7J9FR08_9ROSI|nr:hypothetical protein [Gossypium trilobum]